MGLEIASDEDLIPPDEGSDQAGSGRPFPVLTILCHGDVQRAGERVLLRSLLDGQRMAIQRLEPSFMAPDGQLTGPLDDSFISRRPLWMKWSSKGLEIDPKELSTEVCIDGYPMEEARTIAPEQLERGLVLKLADRVLLFLRQRDPESLYCPPIQGLVGESASMVRLRDQAAMVGATGGHVLLRGAQGTEMENLARAIHAKSQAPKSPFIPVGVMSIPADHLMEAFFGSVGSIAAIVEKPTALSTLDLDDNDAGFETSANTMELERPRSMSTLDLDDSEAGFQALTGSGDTESDDGASDVLDIDDDDSPEPMQVDEDSELGFEAIEASEPDVAPLKVGGLDDDEDEDAPAANSTELYEISSDDDQEDIDDDPEMALNTLDMVDPAPMENRASRTLDLLDDDFSLENLAKNRDGFFGKAVGGVLYIEEVDALPLEVQERLVALVTLKNLEGNAPRIIASTDADLERAVDEGFFDPDLLDMLCEAMVDMPTLSERMEDLGQLFVKYLAAEMRETGEEELLLDRGPARPPWLPADLLGRFMKYDWPGNMTQLRAVARCLVNSSRGAYTVRISDAVECLLPEAPVQVVDTLPDHSGYEIDGLGDSQEDRYLDVLRNSRWIVADAAKRLRISKAALINWMESFDDLRRIEDISAEELLQASRRYHGHIGLIANELEVSRRQLAHRLRELDML